MVVIVVAVVVFQGLGARENVATAAEASARVSGAVLLLRRAARCWCLLLLLLPLFVQVPCTPQGSAAPSLRRVLFTAS